jgi:hypothetical protein
MKGLLVVLFLFMPVASVAGQVVPLREAGEVTRGLWRQQNAAGLVEHSPQLVIQLPGADPSAPVARRQAIELLRDYFSRAEEVDTQLTDAREVGGGWGFVELRRRFRIRGTQEVRVQTLLLSFRANADGWTLMELRAGH